MIVVMVTVLTGHLRRTLWDQNMLNRVKERTSYFPLLPSFHCDLSKSDFTDTLWPYTVSCANIAGFTGKQQQQWLWPYGHYEIMLPDETLGFGAVRPTFSLSPDEWMKMWEIQFVPLLLSTSLDILKHSWAGIEWSSRGNSPAAITHRRASACSKFSGPY